MPSNKTINYLKEKGGKKRIQIERINLQNNTFSLWCMLLNIS